ncbi:MAG: glutamate 5-kinase [Nitrospinales bacterium]
MRKEILKRLKRVVIKVGSGVISSDSEASELDRGLNKDRIKGLAVRIKNIIAAGHEVILVSSGAIMAGRQRLNLDKVNLSIPDKQACAAVGQSFLMHTYEKTFDKQGLKVAQILLGNDDLENRKRYLNAKHTIDALLQHGVIPIINENDSVTVDEIKIGDNDTLSATVACLSDAQLLIILSDVEGLYSRDPASSSINSTLPPDLIPLVEKISPEIEGLAGRSKNPLAVGGMFTKVLAAKKTMSSGIPTLIISGLRGKALEDVFKGKEIGTLFWSGKNKIKNRKHWIAHTLKPAGDIIIDDGAGTAVLEKGKSLLPAGVTEVNGNFKFGSAVRILDSKGKEIGRGLVNYSAADLEKIKGGKSADIRKIMGNDFYKEVIHRDDLVVI